MLYVTIQKPVMVPQAGGEERPYTQENMLDELVWPALRASNRKMWDELTDRFEGIVEGDVVEVTNAECTAMGAALDASVGNMPMSVLRKIKPLCRAIWAAPEKGIPTRAKRTSDLAALEAELEKAKAELAAA